jgi:hypothetical protein
MLWCRAKQWRQQQDDEFAAHDAGRAAVRAAMRAELDRRERDSASALNELQRAKAAVAEQLSRLRREAMAKARARPDKHSIIKAAADAAPATKRTKGAAVDMETLAQLRRSLKVRWRREQMRHDADSLRAAFETHGEVEHVVLRGKAGKSATSAVIVMATAAGAASAMMQPTGLPGAPLLVVPLPAVADMAALDGGMDAATSAAATLRRQGIAQEAPSISTKLPASIFSSFPGARPSDYGTTSEGVADASASYTQQSCALPQGTPVVTSFPGAQSKNVRSTANSSAKSYDHDAPRSASQQPSATQSSCPQTQQAVEVDSKVNAAASDPEGSAAVPVAQGSPRPVSPDPAAENKCMSSATDLGALLQDHTEGATAAAAACREHRRLPRGSSIACPLGGAAGRQNPPPFSSFPVAHDDTSCKRAPIVRQEASVVLQHQQATHDGGHILRRASSKAISHQERRAELLAMAEAEDH